MPETSSPPTPVKHRILIVDSHPLVRRGLTPLINAEPDLIVCGEAATRQAALEAIASSKPDLVVTDLMLQDGTPGLHFVAEIRASRDGLPVVVLTMHDTPLSVRAAFKAGANGYVSKHEMSQTLLLAIRCILSGGKYVSPGIRLSLDTD